MESEPYFNPNHFTVENWCYQSGHGPFAAKEEADCYKAAWRKFKRSEFAEHNEKPSLESFKTRLIFHGLSTLAMFGGYVLSF